MHGEKEKVFGRESFNREAFGERTISKEKTRARAKTKGRTKAKVGGKTHHDKRARRGRTTTIAPHGRTFRRCTYLGRRKKRSKTKYS